MERDGASSSSWSEVEIPSLPDMPVTVEACLAQLQELAYRVAVLESELSTLKGAHPLGQLHKVEYKIGRLYIKDLSGTLSIGIASFADAAELTDLSDLPVHWSGDEVEAWDDEAPWLGEQDPDEPEDV